MKPEKFINKLRNLKQFKNTSTEELLKIAENLLWEKYNPYHLTCPVCHSKFNLKKEERKNIIYEKEKS